MISCKAPFIVNLWILHVAPLYLKVVCKCKWWCCYYLTIFCIAKNSNNMFQVSFLLYICYLFIMLHSLSCGCIWNSIHFGFTKQSLGFKVSSSHCPSSLTIFTCLSDAIVVILQFLALLQASSMTCFVLVSFVILHCCFRNPKSLMKKFDVQYLFFSCKP
jgi:hypothetical protein